MPFVGTKLGSLRTSNWRCHADVLARRCRPKLHQHESSTAFHRSWRPPILQEPTDGEAESKDLVLQFNVHLNESDSTVKWLRTLLDLPSSFVQHTPTRLLDSKRTNHGIQRTSQNGDYWDYQYLRLREALAERNSMEVLYRTWEMSKSPAHYAQIPRSSFNEILRQIQPWNTFSPMHPTYRFLGPKSYGELRTARKRYYEALVHRRQMYKDIVFGRMRSGRKLHLSEYTSLLNLFRATFDGKSAGEVMQNFLRHDIDLDLAAYNAYFEARCWSDTLVPEERQSLRLINLYTRKRRKGWKDDWDGYQVGGHAVEEHGVRWEINQLFSQMTRNGISPDVNSYIHLITAQAREGDLDGLKRILRTVWNIDVDSVLNAETSSADVPKIPPDSPTYPNEQLLFVLAHAFGINSDIPAALRIVEYVSEMYGIKIHQSVWAELLEWTYVVTTYRVGFNSRRGATKGQLPYQSLENLWEVMRGQRYQNEPTMLMYDLIIRHHCQRHHFSRMIRMMREAVAMYEKEASSVSDVNMGSRHKVQTALTHEDSDYIQLAAVNAKSEEERLKNHIPYLLIVRWFRTLVRGRRWNIVKGQKSGKDERLNLWWRRMLPKVIEEFWKYKGRSPVSYLLPGSGRIELQDLNESRPFPSSIDDFRVPQDDHTEGEGFLGEYDDEYGSPEDAEKVFEDDSGDEDDPYAYPENSLRKSVK